MEKLTRHRKAFYEKENDYKTKILELEKVFDKLQARIEELQSRRHEEAASRSSREILELEARLENLKIGEADKTRARLRTLLNREHVSCTVQN